MVNLEIVASVESVANLEIVVKVTHVTHDYSI